MGHEHSDRGRGRDSDGSRMKHEWMDGWMDGEVK